MYVLRRDVDSYMDSIPTGRDSPLWPMLEAELGAPLHPLVYEVIRVEMKLPGAGIVSRIRGLPMGQPIASTHRQPLPRPDGPAFEGVQGGFYARYGDDFLFAHPEAELAREAVRVSDAQLDALGLTVNEKKRRTLYLTPPGRPSLDWPEARRLLRRAFPRHAHLGRRDHRPRREEGPRAPARARPSRADDGAHVERRRSG